MARYIELDALLVKIKRRKERLIHHMRKYYYASNYKEWESIVKEYKSLISFINTLEVKGVDFDFTKEVDMWIEDNGDTNGFFNVEELAKYFFKLGMAASNKAQKGE